MAPKATESAMASVNIMNITEGETGSRAKASYSYYPTVAVDYDS